MKNRLFADLSDANPYFHAADYKAAGHVVVAVKATEGHDYTNPTHTPYTRAAHAEGISVVHYHFARPDNGNTPAEEVANFLNVTKPLYKKGDWFTLDYERFTGRGTSADVVWINEFWKLVNDKTGRRTWLYGSRSYLQEFIGTGNLVVHRLWDADWGTSPDIKQRPYWTIARQTSGDGIGPGPHSLQGVGPCDVNRLATSVFLKIRKP